MYCKGSRPFFVIPEGKDCRPRVVEEYIPVSSYRPMKLHRVLLLLLQLRSKSPIRQTMLKERASKMLTVSLSRRCLGN